MLNSAASSLTLNQNRPHNSNSSIVERDFLSSFPLTKPSGISGPPSLPAPPATTATTTTTTNSSLQSLNHFSNTFNFSNHASSNHGLNHLVNQTDEKDQFQINTILNHLLSDSLNHSRPFNHPSLGGRDLMIPQFDRILPNRSAIQIDSDSDTWVQPAATYFITFYLYIPCARKCIRIPILYRIESELNGKIL